MKNLENFETLKSGKPQEKYMENFYTLAHKNEEGKIDMVLCTMSGHSKHWRFTIVSVSEDGTKIKTYANYFDEKTKKTTTAWVSKWSRRSTAESWLKAIEENCGGPSGWEIVTFAEWLKADKVFVE